jgi:hypothetical protein
MFVLLPGMVEILPGPQDSSLLVAVSNQNHTLGELLGST